MTKAESYKAIQQRLFNKSVKGLARQRYKRAENGSSCLFYDPKTKRRCAIGRLLTVAQARGLQRRADDAGSGGVTYLWRPLLGMLPIARGQRDFLDALQNAHDDSYSPSNPSEMMRQKLTDLAFEYGLELPKELS